jgi:nitrogenase molybdenum-iron protein NifN
VPTTGLAETQGCDPKRAIYSFREKYPEYNHIPVVPVATPDYTGCLETGFAAAVTALIEELVPLAEEAGTRPGQRKKQVAVLAGSHLTPGDLELIKDMIEMFGLRPVLIPDLSDSLDGRLTEDDFNPLTIGGTSVDELGTLGMSLATLVIGPSMNKAADVLQKRTGVPDRRFEHLMGLEAVDEFVQTLADISGEPVPQKLERARAQCQDAMLDSHFMLGMTRVAIAGDGDLLNAFSHLLQGMGAQTVAAVAPSNAPALKSVAVDAVKLGDLEELEKLARANDAEIIISNSHAVESAQRLGLPLLRAGFPQYDLLGGYQKVWVGYQGTRQTLFDLANLLLSLERGEIHPYRSIYAQKPEYRNDTGKASENSGLQH